MHIIIYYFLGMYIVIGTMFAVCLGIKVYQGSKTGEYKGWGIPFNYILAVGASYTIWPVLLAARPLIEYMDVE